MATFLHTADLHLDSSFSAHFSASGAEKRRKEILRSFSKVIELAKTVDILLIAGDLFDSKNVSRETISFIKRKFAEIKDTRIFIVAGNHDPYTSDSVYNLEDFGDNVHIFKTEAECVEIPELKTRVYGASFGGNFCDSRIEIPVISKDGYNNILLLHADLTANNGESRYNPIDKAFIENCGADYLALGHIHKRSEVKREGSTYYAYSGVLEGRGFDECGDMGVYIGEIDDGRVKVEFKKTCVRRMFYTDVDISGATDNIQAEGIILSAIDKIGAYEDMYKVVLQGRIKSGFLRKEIIEEELAHKLCYIEVRDETQNDYNIDEIALQDNLCGEFVRVLKRSKENADLLDDAISLGLEALLGGDR